MHCEAHSHQLHVCRRIAAPLGDGRKQAPAVTEVDAQALKSTVEALVEDVSHRKEHMRS